MYVTGLLAAAQDAGLLHSLAMTLGQTDTTLDFWTWVGRVSSLAGIAAVLVAAVALRYAINAARSARDELAIVQEDHRTLVSELGRSPIAVGFDQPYAIGPGGIRPNGIAVWLTNSTVQQQLGFTVRNDRRRTLKNIVLNFRIPASIPQAVWQPAYGVSVGPALLDTDGAHQLVWPVPILNPGTHLVLTATLDIALDTPPAIEIEAEVSLEDETPYTVPLTVALSPPR